MSAVIYPTTILMATEQLLFERGEGIYVYDNQGKQYLEGMAGLWCTLHTRHVSALHRELDQELHRLALGSSLPLPTPRYPPPLGTHHP